MRLRNSKFCRALVCFKTLPRHSLAETEDNQDNTYSDRVLDHIYQERKLDSFHLERFSSVSVRR